MRAPTNWRTAPAGALPCFICHRYLVPDKLDGGRCEDRESCFRAAASTPNRARALSKRTLKKWAA